MKKLIARFVREETGQDLIEYALLAGIITAVSAATITTISTTVKGLYDALIGALPAGG
jgi:Flp pilus assembly pilin Flp